MLIFSSLDNKKQFVEITSFKDCENIMADTCAFFRIQHSEKESLESYFKLGEKLHKHEVEYSILLDLEVDFVINELYSKATHQNDTKSTRTTSESNMSEQRQSSFQVRKETKHYFQTPTNTQTNTPNTAGTKNHIESFLPLNLLILMFAHYGASFCIMDKRNFSALPLAQSLFNHYLLDIKILGLVDSYREIQNLVYWRIDSLHSQMQPHDSIFNHTEIGIDGFVEKSVLLFKK